MANSKISALTSATTPLAGTETLPVVQSGATKQVSVANLTAGRAVSADSLSLTTALPVTSGGTGFGTLTTGYIPFGAGTSALNSSANLFWDNTNNRLGVGTTSPTGVIAAVQTSTGAALAGVVVSNTGLTAGSTVRINFLTGEDGTVGRTRALIEASTPAANDGGLTFYTRSAGATAARLSINASNITVNTGNLIQGTAAKGFDFTANTPAAGKTSTLLNWYEEGTWTPNQGSGLTVIGAFSSTGKYTRVGRNLTISGTVTGATSVAVAAAGIITTNLPFTVGTAGHGNITNVALTAFAAIICTTTNVTSAGAIAATGTLTFSATYFV